MAAVTRVLGIPSDHIFAAEHWHPWTREEAMRLNPFYTSRVRTDAHLYTCDRLGADGPVPRTRSGRSSAAATRGTTSRRARCRSPIRSAATGSTCRAVRPDARGRDAFVQQEAVRMDYRDLIAVVTGASTGIGRETALELAR